MLSLTNLTYFSEENNDECMGVLRCSQDPKSQYFFACCGICITFGLLKMMREWELVLHFRGVEFISDGLRIFNELYCRVFWDVNRYWIGSPLSENFMNFQMVMNEYWVERKQFVVNTTNILS
jgi:hypothetical protein